MLFQQKENASKYYVKKITVNVYSNAAATITRIKFKPSIYRLSVFKKNPSTIDIFFSNEEKFSE